MAGFQALKEFFQDVNGDPSMARLIIFGSWLVSSSIMFWIQYQGKMTEGYLGLYLANFVVNYGLSKYNDTKLALGKPQ